MAVLELYGRCREEGYCICGGRNGCIDDEGPKRTVRDSEEYKRLAQRRPQHRHLPEWKDELIHSLMTKRVDKSE
jgi:hypothetical protein